MQHGASATVLGEGLRETREGIESGDEIVAEMKLDVVLLQHCLRTVYGWNLKGQQRHENREYSQWNTMKGKTCKETFSFILIDFRFWERSVYDPPARGSYST